MDIFPTIEDWVASKDNLRVISHGVSRSFPIVFRVMVNTPLIDFYDDNNLELKIRDILTRNDISFITFSIRRMIETDVPQSHCRESDRSFHQADIPTLAITTLSENTRNWKIAAEEIFSIYADGGFSKTKPRS